MLAHDDGECQNESQTRGITGIRGDGEWAVKWSTVDISNIIRLSLDLAEEDVKNALVL